MPDTTDYLIGALAIVSIISILYVVSLSIRFSNARKEMAVLKELGTD